MKGASSGKCTSVQRDFFFEETKNLEIYSLCLKQSLLEELYGTIIFKLIDLGSRVHELVNCFFHPFSIIPTRRVVVVKL